MGAIGKTLAAIVVVMLGGCAANAQNKHSAHAMHAQKVGGHTVQAQEQGQSAFAAIAELVGILSADPATDWSKVSIDALREHLLDMQQVTLATTVQREKISSGGYAFNVSGEGRVIAAIQRMVPAHSQVIAGSLDWRVATELTDTGVVLKVQSEDELEQQKIAALGFYGFMAIGAHHQAHHQAMARGETVHQH